MLVLLVERWLLIRGGPLFPYVLFLTKFAIDEIYTVVNKTRRISKYLNPASYGARKAVYIRAVFAQQKSSVKTSLKATISGFYYLVLTIMSLGFLDAWKLVYHCCKRFCRCFSPSLFMFCPENLTIYLYDICQKQFRDPLVPKTVWYVFIQKDFRHISYLKNCHWISLLIFFFILKNSSYVTISNGLILKAHFYRTITGKY